MSYQAEAFDASSEMVRRASKHTDLGVKRAVFEMLPILINLAVHGAALLCCTY